jgi:hypothetical protein
MGAPITIYEVRENDVVNNGYEAIVESRSLRLFQTKLAAQLYLQERLNFKLEVRTKLAQDKSNSLLATPESIAAVAANKLRCDDSDFIQNEIEYNNIELGANPLLFIQELLVYP